MAVSGDKSSLDYLRLLMQLLPAGYAWQWSPMSVGRHLLAAWADELARVHTHFVTLVTQGISRFAGELPAWSAADYERLLARLGIKAEVSDGLLPFTCESACTDPLLEESIRYVIVFTVEDASTIAPSVHRQLAAYKQSHTHYLFRDRSIVLERVQAVDSMHLGESEQQITVHYAPSVPDETYANDSLIDPAHAEQRTQVTNGLHCESALYEQPFQAYRLHCHWSFSHDDIRQFAGWSQIANDLDSHPLLLT